MKKPNNHFSIEENIKVEQNDFDETDFENYEDYRLSST